MTTNAIKFKGTTIGIGQGDGASTAPGVDTFDLIGEILDFNGPDGQAAVIDATHAGSTAKEKLMGLPDEGQFSFSTNYIPGDAGQDAALAARDSQTLKNIQVTLSDGTIFDFKAFVLGFVPTGAVDGKLSAQLTLEVSGPKTIN